MLDLDIQHIWNELSWKKPWRTLALVPTSPTRDVVELACSMGQLAAYDNKHAVIVINTLEQKSFDSPYFDVVNLRDLSIPKEDIVYDYLPHLFEQMAHEGKRVIVVLDELVKHPYFVPIVRMLDASILCIHLGESLFARSKKIIDMIGQEKILGCITFRS